MSTVYHNLIVSFERKGSGKNFRGYFPSNISIYMMRQAKAINK
jgi:hypothetical protein